MPIYSKSDIRQIIQEEEFEKMMKVTPLPRDRLFLALLYCTGARPSEISGDNYRGIPRMTWGQILHNEQDKYIENNELLLKMYNSKKEKTGFSLKERRIILTFDKDHIDLPIRIIFDGIIMEKKQAEREKREIDLKKPIFDFTRRTGYNIVSKAGRIIGRSICPYNFRHSRLTLLSEQGADINTLLTVKGSDDINSITPYLHAKEVRMRLGRRKEP
jgi:hypothetical protein